MSDAETFIIKFFFSLYCMEKKGLIIFFFLLIFIFGFSTLTLAEEDILSGAQQEFENAQLEHDAGITPDSAFYFLDEFFDRFGDDLANKEEKIAEIKVMIEEGKYDEARKALENYNKFADSLEEEINPEKRDEARRSAAAIKNVLEALEEEIPEEEREDFVNNIIDKEEKILTSVEIASKIKELCEQLSKLDPEKYYELCHANDDDPEWQIELDDKLTKEQREEALKFGEIMSECFKTSGRECRCNDIPFESFSKACSEAAPLAIACDIKGDENACIELDNLEMPRLPPHLQNVFDDLEDISEAQFDLHIPRECVEAGVTDRRECEKIMINTNAPPECREALIAANVQNERDGRGICEKIMMEIHAPDCAREGIINLDECARYMDSFRGEDNFNRRDGPRIDFDCREIANSNERLDCYDKASSQARSYNGFDDEHYDGLCMTENDWQMKRQECRSLYGDHAGEEPINGDSGEGYQCVVDAKCIDYGKGIIGGPEEGCETIFCGEGAFCEYGVCTPYEENGEEHLEREDFEENEQFSDGSESEESSDFIPDSSESEDDGFSDEEGSTEEEESSEPSPPSETRSDDSGSSTGSDEGSSDGGSGSGGITGNAFLEYYY